MNRSPTEIFSTLPRRTRTTEGGIICPKVPDDAITPVASFVLYPLFIITGKLISPIVTTVAPTIPVDAASIPPTMITEYANPPLILPNNMAIVSRSFSAIPDLSSVIPIKIKRGTARRTKLFIIPKILSDTK